MLMLPSVEQEIHVLEQAMTECRRRLAYSRIENDQLQIDLLEADLNLMLERWSKLHGTSTPA